MTRPLVHGSQSAYVRGCRCLRCRAAATAYQRARRSGGREYLTASAKRLCDRPAERALDAGRCRRRCPNGHLWTPKGRAAAEQPCPRCGDTGTDRRAA